MRKISLLCATAALAMPVAVYAQETTSSIRGSVTSGGSPVAGAEVRIVNVPSGTTNTVTTDAEGNFSAQGLRVGGPYTVTVTSAGAEAVTTEVASLTAGQPFIVPVDLAEAGEAIVVTGTRGPRREQSQGPITTLTREEIEGVASVSRDVRDIARRDPFANIDQSNSRAVEIAGNNARLNRFSVDGLQFSDDFGLNNGGLPTARGPVPFDAIEQLSVKTAPYDVEEGDFQGGAINVILRSGGNRFTGSAFFSYLDDSLTGDKIRGVPVDLEFDSKQYGAFLSGPIIKDRLFFAVAYERTEEGDPTDEGPTGLGFANEIPRVTQATVDQITGIANSVYSFDPLGVFTTANETDEKYTIKIDANISDNHRASLTYIHNTGTNQFTQNNSVSPTNPTLGFQSNGYELSEEFNSGVFQLNSTWTDELSTEVRVAYRDVNRDQTPFGGREFAQFEVCLDPTSVGATTTCTLASGATATAPAVLATPRVFFGPDVSRQSNDLNTENLSADFKATLQAGAHNFKFLAAYTDIDVFNLFLQRSLGDVYFDSIADFQARRASRVRLGGAVPSLDPNDAAASFSTQTFTFGIQDDWDVTDDLQVTIGARFDLLASDDRPALNPNFLNRYGFSNRSTFTGRSIFQPRIGFDWKPTNRLNISGGVGIFGGGSPEVFLSNSFSNTGTLTNAIDISRNTTAQGCNQTVGATPAERAAFCTAALTGITGTGFPSAVTNFLATNLGSLAGAPTNAVDPDFDLPSQIVATLSAQYDFDLGPLGDGWLIGVDGYYAEVNRGLDFVDLRSRVIGTLPDGRPRYADFDGNNNNTNQDLLLTNDNRGRRMIGVARVRKEFDMGLGINASYTYQDIEDVNATTSATAGSNYANNQFVDPNKAAYGTSIYQIRHSVKAGIDYARAFFGGDYETRISIFGERRSGRPYSFTFRDPVTQRSPVFGTTGSSSRYLLYVPSSGTDALVSYDSAATRDAFNSYVDSTGALSKFRGRIVPKNTARSPTYTKVDLHVEQEIPTFIGSSRIKLFADVENFLNLLDSDWGVQRQVNFPQNASLVNVQCLTTAVATGTPVGNVGATPPAGGVAAVATTPTQACAQYRYSSFAEPVLQVQNGNRQSLYQIRVGVRFEF
jgi:hypothetical protein